MNKKDLIADIKIFSDSTVDAKVSCNSNNLNIIIAGIYQVIEKLCNGDKALKYGIISSFILMSGVDINQVKEGIDEYEKQQ